jgi:hypothetical protein
MGYNKRRRKKFENFIMLGRDMLLHCEEWKRLSSAAKLVYIYLKAKHTGRNNGEICLFYSELETLRGLGSPSTVSRAFKELEQGGWIRRTRYGGIYRLPNQYGLTGKYDSHIADPRITGPANYKEPTISVVEKGTSLAPAKTNLQGSSAASSACSSSRASEIEAQDSISCS